MVYDLPVKTEQKCVPSSPKEFFARLYGHLESECNDEARGNGNVAVITKHPDPIPVAQTTDNFGHDTAHSTSAVSYTHLDVYKRQYRGTRNYFRVQCGTCKIFR